jgi:hypothetical protein
MLGTVREATCNGGRASYRPLVCNPLGDVHWSCRDESFTRIDMRTDGWIEGVIRERGVASLKSRRPNLVDIRSLAPFRSRSSLRSMISTSSGFLPSGALSKP